MVTVFAVYSVTKLLYLVKDFKVNDWIFTYRIELFASTMNKSLVCNTAKLRHTILLVTTNQSQTRMMKQISNTRIIIIIVTG
jgi:hypothetical protein